LSTGLHVLTPFPGGNPPPVRLEAVVRRQQDVLLLCYLLRGPLAELTIPGRAGQPERLDGLWRQTCFELFLAPATGRNYWEVNLSPAGHWNIYAFDDYRTGVRPEAAVSSLSFNVAREENSLAVVLELPVSGLAGSGASLAVGPAVVLAARNNELSYWALQHHGPGADFHRRDSLAVIL
jgi:hypothetical protein